MSIEALQLQAPSSSGSRSTLTYLSKLALRPDSRKLEGLKRRIAHDNYWVEAHALSQRITEFYDSQDPTSS
jgi:hypothetical protein